MSHPAILAALLLLATTLVALRYVPLGWAESARATLDGRALPWILGVVTALAFFWVAGGTLDVEPISTDEASYLLQAEIFAAGRATAPPPPIREFFEQAWVVVEPRIFSKYPPGHSLALAPGVALGLPWLVPLLLNLVSGALLFGLLRRAVGAPAAVLTWGAWVLSGMAMAWQTSYFSEVTSMACWLGAVALGWRWIDGGGRRWLVGAAALVGYGMLTRPLSILLLALPLAFVILRSAKERGRWRDLWTAAAVAAGFLLAVPAWNSATTGAATTSPLSLYTETYLPWDRVGFAVESTAARRATPPDLEGIAPQLARVHREHTVARLPQTYWARGTHVVRLLFGHWRAIFIAFALLGIWRLRGAGLAAVASAGTLFFGHGVWGHEAGWTIYYAESAAAWYIPGAIGIVAAITWLARRVGPAAEAQPRVAAAVCCALPFLLYFSIENSAPYRDWRRGRAENSRALTEVVRTGPGNAIYFIKYGPLTSGRPGLIRNDPWLATARDWIVYDLGPRNEELRRLAPGRAAFIVDVAARSVVPLPPLGPPTP